MLADGGTQTEALQRWGMLLGGGAEAPHTCGAFLTFIRDLSDKRIVKTRRKSLRPERRA